MTKWDKNPLSHLRDIIKDLGFDAFHSLNYWKHNLRGNRVRKNYLKRQSDHHPIILVQGFMGTRGVLIPLENHLRAHGRDVISIDLGTFNVQDIRKSAQILSAKIERLLEKFSPSLGLEKINIVGHSMGGLIALYYVKRLGGHRVVDKLITLGAPFKGTWASYLGMIPLGLFSKGLWQMRPNSKFLGSLKSRPEEVHETQVTSIAARYDTICPPGACHLEWAQNDIVSVGHASLLMDPKVFEVVVRHLDRHRESAKIFNLNRK